MELLNHVLIAKELNFIDEKEIREIREEVSKITNQLIA